MKDERPLLTTHSLTHYGAARSIQLAQWGLAVAGKGTPPKISFI